MAGGANKRQEGRFFLLYSGWCTFSYWVEFIITNNVSCLEARDDAWHQVVWYEMVNRVACENQTQLWLRRKGICF